MEDPALPIWDVVIGEDRGMEWIGAVWNTFGLDPCLSTAISIDQQINRLTLEFSLSEYIDQAEDLLEITEDMVEYFCDEQGASGQRVWTMLHALSEYKISEFPEY